MKSLVCCLSVRNCAAFLPAIFRNLDALRRLPIKMHVVFAIDNSTDRSETLLAEYKSRRPDVVIVKVANTSPLRTVRIARARNACLGVLSGLSPGPDFHAMIDADDVNAAQWDIPFLWQCLNTSDWDSLSFNRPYYYDLWALMLDQYKYHALGFGAHTHRVMDHLRTMLTKELQGSDGDTVTCLSAFNGFAFYRTPMFAGLKYTGTYEEFKPLVSDAERQLTLETLRKELDLPELRLMGGYDRGQHCEHLYYHVRAVRERSAQIRIHKRSMFINSARS